MIEGKPGRGLICAVAIAVCGLIAACVHDEVKGDPAAQSEEAPQAEAPSAPPDPVADAAEAVLDLPVSATAETPRKEDFLEVSIDADRQVRAEGQRMSFRVLTDWLSDHAESEREVDVRTTPSRRAVLVSADREARWRDVQWTLSACADPNVRIYRIYLAVLDTAGGRAVLPLFLPKDMSNQEPEATLEVYLKWDAEESRTRVKLLDSMIGPGDRGFEQLQRRVGPILKQCPGLPGSLEAWDEVPLRDAVRALDILRGHGISRIKFHGPPPPR